jgi:predicted dehydrogenase
VDIALIGLGYWGRKLLRNLVDVHGAEHVVIVDHDLDAVAAAARAHSGVHIAFDVDEALRDPSVMGVIIATPAIHHAPLALAALDAGKHVLVEKPMATSRADALAMLDLARQRERVLMVGHTFLFSPPVRLLRELIATGHLGAVHHLSSRRLNLGLVREDTNVIWDLAPHDFSIVVHLLGERPCLVQTAARNGIGNTPEVAFINLTFPSGVVASVAVSWLAPRKVRDVTVVGSTRMAVFDDTSGEEPVRVFDRGILTEEGPGFADHQLTYRYGDIVSPYVAPNEPLRIQLQEFVAAMHGAAEPVSDGRLGLDIVTLLEAAERSWRENGVAVEPELSGTTVS